MKSPRAAIGFLLLTGMAIWANVEFLRQGAATRFHFTDLDCVPDYEARLAPICKLVPADAVLGYIDDIPSPTNAPSGKYLLSQYVLAPRVLRHGTDNALVIVNYESPGHRFVPPAGLSPAQVRDFGQGIWLCRNVEAP